MTILRQSPRPESGTVETWSQQLLASIRGWWGRLESLASESTSAAEIRRALVALSRELGVAPPSYEHVRRLVVERRAVIAEARDADMLPLIVDVALGIQHGNELMRVARGGRPRRRR